MNKHPENDHSAGEEVRHLIRDKFTKLIEWYRPDRELSTLKNIIFMILKTPVMLFILLLSPFALLIMLFTFIAAF